MANRYKFRDGTRICGVDPQLAGEAIEDLKSSADGPLTPEAVVDSARDRRSPLHGAFEWDDGEAARKHRIWQARYLMGAIEVSVVINDTPSVNTRAFVNVREDGAQGYVGLAEAISHTVYRDSLLMQARGDARRFAQKYRTLKELASVIVSIDALLETDT